MSLRSSACVRCISSSPEVIHRFHYLKVGLSVVLVFVGVKMLAGNVYKVPVGVSLGVIVCVLGASIGASWLWPSTAAAHHVPDPASGAGSAPPDSGGTELRRQFPRVPGEENADSVEPVRGTS